MCCYLDGDEKVPRRLEERELQLEQKIMAQHGLCFFGLYVNYCRIRSWLNDFSRICLAPLSVHSNKNISQESLKNCCSQTFPPAGLLFAALTTGLDLQGLCLDRDLEDNSSRSNKSTVVRDSEKKAGGSRRPDIYVFSCPCYFATMKCSANNN